jgi:sugar phosphate isomerase/epimerase
MPVTRRHFLRSAAIASLSTLPLTARLRAAHAAQLRIGLVTYLWGKDWDLATIIDNCTKSGVLGVELRTEHAHGVEPSLSQAQRQEVRQRFKDSPVTLVGYGSNAQFHEADPEKVKHNIELTKQYVRLMHDCGGSGVKVKPNGFVAGVPHEKTLAQIGRALNVVGSFAADYGQKIRVEAHGRGTQELPNMKAIFDHVSEPNVGVCWNCNGVDVQGDGFDANFDLVKDRLADTVHVREMNVGNYPYPRLIERLVDVDYQGWILLECRTEPSDGIAAMKQQKQLLDQYVAQAGH